MNIDQIRADFPILSRTIHGKPLIYLDNAATSHKPQSVITAITNYYAEHNANIHRGIHTLADESTHLYQQARLTVSRFIGAMYPEELIFVRNTTEAINLVAYSWGLANLHSEDEVIVSELEHHSNLVIWQRICQQTGAKLIYHPIDHNGDLVIEHLETIISKRTKLLALTHVSNVLGTILDIPHLLKDLRRHGYKGKILIDGAQSAPHMPTDVANWDIDFLAFSGHKMLGPMGIGGLYIRKDTLIELEPFLLGGGMIDHVDTHHSTWADLPDRFDAGTPNVEGAIGLATACDYLSKLGMSNIRAHELELTRYGLEQFLILQQQGLLILYGLKDPEKRAGIITFNLTGIHAHDVAQLLDRHHGIAIRSGHHCGQLVMRKLNVPATCRASFYLYNTKEEIDILVAALKDVHQRMS